MSGSTHLPSEHYTVFSLLFFFLLVRWYSWRGNPVRSLGSYGVTLLCYPLPLPRTVVLCTVSSALVSL